MNEYLVISCELTRLFLGKEKGSSSFCQLFHMKPFVSFLISLIVVRMEESRCTVKIVTVKLTGKRPLERLLGRWEDNIRMDMKEIGINTSKWVDSAQDMAYRKSM